MPQQINLDNLPDQVDLSNLPDQHEEPVTQPKKLTGVPERSLLEHFTEAPRFVTNAADSVANTIDNPQGEGGYLKGFLAGAIQGASRLFSPLNVLTAALPGGESLAAAKGMTNTARALRGANLAINAGTALEGGNRIVTGEGLGAKAQGVAELAGSLAGMRSPKGKIPLPEERISAPKDIIPKPDIIAEQPITPEVLPSETTQLAPPKPKVKLNLDGTYSPIDQPLIKLDQAGKPLPSPVDKLLSAVKASKPLNKLQSDIYSVERSERVGAADAIKTPGLKGHYERLGQLKGEHTKVVNEPLKLNSDDVDALVNHVNASPLPFYGRINATQGLLKVINGQVPTESEVRLLSSVFGKGTIEQLREHLPKIDKRGTLVQEVLSLPKALQASMDLSFGMRQGLGLIHTPSWWGNMWKQATKAFGSETVYNGIQEGILDRPNAKAIIENGVETPSVYDRAGLALTDLNDLSTREEKAMSSIAEAVPGVRASNRAYTAAANTLRADNLDSLLNQLDVIYNTAKETGKARPGILMQEFTPEQAELLNWRKNPAILKELGKYVNTASGRGSLGKLEGQAVNLNTMLFSPRLISSRLAMLNPATYITASPFVRKQYLKSAMGIGATWLTLASLAKLAGAEVSTDMNSADFGKIKMGNTRLDPTGGFQQYLVLAHRLASGGTTSSTTGKESTFGEKYGSQTRGDALVQFGRNKLAPVPSYITDALFANKKRPFDVSDRTIQLFTPMILQDMSELMQDPDVAKMIGIPLGAAGMGVQSYGKSGTDKPVIPGVSGPKVY